MIHLAHVTLAAEQFPTREHYPFCLPLLQQTPQVTFPTPLTFFVGENGAGKSTLLEAIAHTCGIHIWGEPPAGRVGPLGRNPYEGLLHRYVRPCWTDGIVPGSFFAGQIFEHFAELLDRIAEQDPGQLEYFGGKSLVTQSHGESLMSFFTARYRIKGLYLLDEPETALSPRRQVDLARLLLAMAAAGHAQFIVATHSPILLACPGATIYSFDAAPLRTITFEQTEHYQLYKSFLDDPDRFLNV